jgi:peptidyl-prolyl cis-trans isomerase C
LAISGIAAPAPDTVIATVNEAEILQSDIDFIFATFVAPQVQQQMQGQELPADQKAQVEQNILDQLIVQKLILEEASQLNITGDETELQKQIDEAKEYLPDADMERLEQLLRNDLAVQQTIQDLVVAKIDVSDEEIQGYYDERQEQFLEPEQVKASHIIVMLEADADQDTKDAARQRIDEVLVKANAGEDFAELAKEFSEGPSKDTGGDLGFFGRGQMVPEFEDAAFAMNPGDISDIVETQFGYHIIKVTEKKAERQIPLEEATEQIRQTLLDERTNTEVPTWIEALRANAVIEIAGGEDAPEGEETAAESEEQVPESGDVESAEEPATE